jgi:hypothetical protein
VSDLWSAEEDVQKNWLIEYFVLEVALMVLTIRVMVIVLSVLFIALNSVSASEGEDDSHPDVPFSPPTKTCIGCHSNFTPGIVQDWLRSRHAQITPGEALKKSTLERRISAESLSEDLMRHAVGCYECHGLNTAGRATLRRQNSFPAARNHMLTKSSWITRFMHRWFLQLPA